MPARPGRRSRTNSRYAGQAARLSEKLRELRVSAGMTQERLAARAEVAVSTVRKIESGDVIEPGFFTVLALIDALGVSLDEFGRSPAHAQQQQNGGIRPSPDLRS